MKSEKVELDKISDIVKEFIPALGNPSTKGIVVRYSQKD